jgi:TRAP-type C4-dicarboxylate transport system permease large subunit
MGVEFFGLGEMMHAQFLKFGQSNWAEYHELRYDPKPPTCDPQSFVVVSSTASQDQPEASDDLDDLLDDEGEETAPNDAEEAALDELLDGDDPQPSSPTSENEDDLDDLLDDEEPDEDDSVATQAAMHAAKKNCEEKHATYARISKRISPSVKRFRAVEHFVAQAALFGLNYLRHILVCLLLICAVTATALKHHIALRPAVTKLDHRVSEFAQLVANVMLLISSIALIKVDEASGIVIEHPELHYLWSFGFLCLCMTNLYHLVRLPADAQASSGSPVKALARASLTVPIYAVMCLVSGTYFLIAEGHTSGLAIYLSKLTEHAILYIHVGLYVWVGMILKRTRLASLCFDVLRPLKLSPEILAFVTVVAAALPTAYSGASGIFVIAVGAVIYKELRAAGARPQLALAATAMSGSMGVVLSPCLLVVIVASLNKQVTTDQLYGWGFKVFLLTATLFLVASLINRKGPLMGSRLKDAIPQVLREALALLPYVSIAAIMLLGYHLLLGTHLDEHTAPIILPALLLVLLAYDRVSLFCKHKKANENTSDTQGTVGCLEEATCETTGHIGALLMLMGLSICLGGIVERADLMAHVPHSFGSVGLTMTVLVVVLVIIGMTMDPYGAVILVSATIADVAYRNGINPVHFWMVVLVAFELGYLTPPVALNHLLTRQVVGDEEVNASANESSSFWNRHERILLPIVVMGTALLIVSYVPLLWGTS